MQQGFQCRHVQLDNGQIIKNICRTCRGQGALKDNKTLSVNIPVNNGDKVRLSVDERQRGDLYVAIRVSENPLFERDGRHLYIEAPIPFDISVIGGSIQIPTLENSISLKIPSNTQTGKVFRIKGKGASIVRDRRRGDILCRVVVETPSNLSKQQLEMLNKFKDSLNMIRIIQVVVLFQKLFQK